MQEVPNAQVGEVRLGEGGMAKATKQLEDRGGFKHSSARIEGSCSLPPCYVPSSKISKKKLILNLPMHTENTELNYRLRIHIILTSEQQMDDRGLHENFLDL